MAERAVVAAFAAILVHEGAGLAGTKEMAHGATRWQLRRVVGTLSKHSGPEAWQGRDCNSSFSRMFRIRSACSTAVERVWL